MLSPTQVADTYFLESRHQLLEIAGGASCHVGYRSCFYRKVPVGAARKEGTALEFLEAEKSFDPKAVYGDAPNPTQL